MDKWKTELEAHFKEQKNAKRQQKNKEDDYKKLAKRLIKKTVLPAFEELGKELGKHKREIAIDRKKDWAALMVRRNKKKEFAYEITLSSDSGQVLVSRCVYYPNEKGKLKLGMEGKIHPDEKSAQYNHIKPDDIITDFLECYKQAARSK